MELRIKACIRTQRFPTATAADAESNVFTTFAQNPGASGVKESMNGGPLIAGLLSTLLLSLLTAPDFLHKTAPSSQAPEVWLGRQPLHPAPGTGSCSSRAKRGHITVGPPWNGSGGQPSLSFWSTAGQTPGSFTHVPCRRRRLGEQR